MASREPIGQNFVQVCTTTPCMLRGSTDILNTVCSHLGGIKPGDTTKDGKFTVIEVECQGACSNAPMMVVGDDFYVRLLVIYTHAFYSHHRYIRRISHRNPRRKSSMPLQRVKSPNLALKAADERVRTLLVLPPSRRRYALSCRFIKALN